MDSQIKISIDSNVAQPSQEVCDEIKTWLAVSEPCTLEELMGAVAQGCGIGTEHLLPATILAIAALMISGEICQYIDRQLFDEPLDYSWLLSKEATQPKGRSPAVHSLKTITQKEPRMDNSINFYLPKNIATPLAAQYGDQLEEMPLSIKLLLIHALSGGLHELEICPPLSDYSFVEFCHEKGMPDDLLEDVLPLLEQFDKYDSGTAQTILLVLALSM